MKIFTNIIIAFLLISQSAFAQFPETFNYQAVARNNDGSPIINTEITIEVSIIQGNGCETNPGTCNLIWQELHFPTTNEFGLFSINIGDGQNTFAGTALNFNAIDWNDFSSGNYFVTLRVDFGNSTYINGLINMGTVKLQAVPYSTSAKTAENIIKTSGKLPFNVSELFDVNLTGLTTNNVLSWNGSEWVNINVASTVVMALGDLSDITITAPATGQTVLYNGTNWANSLIQLNLNSDVSLTALSSGDLLKFNGTNWINSTIAVNNLSDVNISGLTNGEIFQYNGTNWVNSSLAINNLNDVIITGAANGEALVFNGTNWVNQSVGSPWTNNGSYVYYNGSLNVGIGTATPAERFHLSTSANEGILVTGTFNASGSVPNWGAGTRMTFYPNYAAFRAGSVDGTQWDNTFMGKYSAAFGSNNKAGGTGSFASGTSNVAYGVNSFVFGNNNNASVGSGSDNSIVGGNGNNSVGNNSLTIGTNNTNSTDNSIVFGENSQNGGTGTGSISGGNATTARGDYSQAFGVENTAGAYASMVIGRFNNIGSYNAIAWSAGDAAFVVGNGTDAFNRNNAVVIFKNGNISIEGTVSENATNPAKSGKINNYSDILKLNAYSSNLKGKNYFGFSGAEVEKLFPSLVSDFNNSKVIAYTQFIPLIIETVKTQQNKIENLQTENATLKKKLDDMDLRLQKLENKK